MGMVLIKNQKSEDGVYFIFINSSQILTEKQLNDGLDKIMLATALACNKLSEFLIEFLINFKRDCQVISCDTRSYYSAWRSKPFTELEQSFLQDTLSTVLKCEVNITGFNN